MDGETDVLDSAGRQVLVNLVKGPAIDGERQPHLWATLVRQKDRIEVRLADLYLELVVNHDLKVAYCRQHEDPDEPVPVLLRRVKLRFLQSALALFLRQQLSAAETRGERATVSDQDIDDHLAVYRRTGDRDLAKFSKAVQGAVEKFKKFNLLRVLDGSPDRYEVSPALGLVFSADKIRALEQLYASVPSDSEVEANDEEDPE